VAIAVHKRGGANRINYRSVSCAANPDDSSHKTIEAFVLPNANGTINKNVQYAFCAAPISVDGTAQGDAVFLITHDTGAQSVTATILVLTGTAPGPEGMYDAATIGSDHKLQSAPFQIYYDGTTFWRVPANGVKSENGGGGRRPKNTRSDSGRS